MAQLDWLEVTAPTQMHPVVQPTSSPPEIPMQTIEREAPAKAEGAYKTISEVADELGVPTHVLRFWESRFPQVKPQRMRGSRRYYRPEDVDTLKKIKTLLYSQGYTIKGAKKHVKEKLPMLQAEEALPQPTQQVIKPAAVEKKAEIRSLINELRELKKRLEPFSAPTRR